MDLHGVCGWKQGLGGEVVGFPLLGGLTVLPGAVNSSKVLLSTLLWWGSAAPAHPSQRSCWCCPGAQVLQSFSYSLFQLNLWIWVLFFRLRWVFFFCAASPQQPVMPKGTGVGYQCDVGCVQLLLPTDSLCACQGQGMGDFLGHTKVTCADAMAGALCE